MKQKRIQTEDFFIGNLGSSEATDELVSVCSKSIDHPDTDSYYAKVGGSKVPNYVHRKCIISWIDTTKLNFINQGLKKIVHGINLMSWKMPLDGEWDTNIQYTRYTGEGHHYGWHKDNFQGNCSDRKLSVVYCLSKKTDYTGGEFDIRKNTNKETYTIKFDYGDFIVFPSYTMHRVRPLKSGVRSTLVGWYR
jgi:PKHD-type hydroxylase|tara:strand:+ start:81 stop:656 length:576 start_codon:yes stop_codon:yes gene_type:complete